MGINRRPRSASLRQKRRASGGAVFDFEGPALGYVNRLFRAVVRRCEFEESLEDLGGDLNDLVRVRIYVTTMDDDALEGYSRRRDGRADFYNDPEHYPASTMVKIDSLVLEEAMVEIDAEAIIPDDGWETTVQGPGEWPYSG